MKNNKLLLKYNLILIVGVMILTAIDQYTKYMAEKCLSTGKTISLIKGVLEFNYLENKGAAFGIFQNKQIIFVIITVIFILISLFYYDYLPMTSRFVPIRLIIIFLISGSLGNLIDRIEDKYVVDFIYFRLIDFPVFNVADIFVTCSLFVFAILLIFKYKDEDLEFFKIKIRK